MKTNRIHDGTLSRRTPDRSINLSDNDLSEAVENWVQEHYGITVGHWRAIHDSGLSRSTFDWTVVEKLVEKP